MPTKLGHSGEVQATTSSAVPLYERPGTSGVSCQPQRVRALTSLPDALENPVWLPLNSGAANSPPFTAQPGVQANTVKCAPIFFFFHR